MDIAANLEENEPLAGGLPTFPNLKSSLYCLLSLRAEEISLSKDGGRKHYQVLFTRKMIFTYLPPPTASSSIGYLHRWYLRICQQLFYEVFTINAFIHGQQFPHVWIATRETYKFFKGVKEEAMQHMPLTFLTKRSWVIMS